MEIKRKNINRGYTRLRVWEDALTLYKLVFEILKDLPYELKKSKINILDASNSILRNISEGYSRRSIKEYLNFLNIALGSCSELFSGIYSFHVLQKIDENIFEKFDSQHYKVENELLNLIKSLQSKQKNGEWSDSFIDK